MVRLIVMYEKPSDVEAFDRHYREVHVPLAKKLAGLRRFTLGRRGVSVRGEPFHLAAELDWEDMTAVQRAFQSPEGQATAQDVTDHLQPLCPGIRSVIVQVEEA